MRIEPLGDCALSIRVVEEFHPETSIDAVLLLLDRLTVAALAGVTELTPAYTTIGVFYDPAQTTFEVLKTNIEAILGNAELVGSRGESDGLIEVPVCYETEFALDLDEVARHTGLSCDEIVRRHSGASYRVSCVGFTPGFPYLSGLPVELATPRRASPRKEIPAGAIAIGGTQTGIYPNKSPGGWNIIGRTPLRLFDLKRDPPAMFRAGDNVRFRKISGEEFERMSR